MTSFGERAPWAHLSVSTVPHGPSRGPTNPTAHGTPLRRNGRLCDSALGLFSDRGSLSGLRGMASKIHGGGHARCSFIKSVDPSQGPRHRQGARDRQQVGAHGRRGGAPGAQRHPHQAGNPRHDPGSRWGHPHATMRERSPRNLAHGQTVTPPRQPSFPRTISARFIQFGALRKLLPVEVLQE